MNDPHVESLTYELETEESVSFDAPPLEEETETFSLRLENQTLHVDLKKHFASVEGARNHVEYYLDSWEAKDGLERGRSAFTFSFDDSEVVDRDPPREEESVSVAVSESVQVSQTVGVHVSHREYPSPPDRFRLSPDAQMLWERYKGYEEGRERLFSMGYACCNYLTEVLGDGLKDAAKKYNISRNLLKKLKTLTSTRGRPEVARKPSDSQGEAAPEERKWIEEAIRKIIRQVGISDGGHDPEKLTKGDLPPLP